MATISPKLPDEMAARLDALARRPHVSRTELVRETLTAMLGGGGAAPSIDDLDGDLVGSLEGPGDLSTDKKHWEGFGRRAVRRSWTRDRAWCCSAATSVTTPEPRLK